MNIDFIKKIFTRKGNKDRWRYSFALVTAGRDWSIVFFSFLVLNIAFVAFNIYLFFEIRQGDIFTVEQNGSVKIETIDRNMLSDTLFILEEKEATFNDLLGNAPSIIDPSR